MYLCTYVCTYVLIANKERVERIYCTARFCCWHIAIFCYYFLHNNKQETQNLILLTYAPQLYEKYLPCGGRQMLPRVTFINPLRPLQFFFSLFLSPLRLACCSTMTACLLAIFEIHSTFVHMYISMCIHTHTCMSISQYRHVSQFTVLQQSVKQFSLCSLFILEYWCGKLRASTQPRYKYLCTYIHTYVHMWLMYFLYINLWQLCTYAVICFQVGKCIAERIMYRFFALFLILMHNAAIAAAAAVAASGSRHMGGRVSGWFAFFD